MYARYFRYERVSDGFSYRPAIANLGCERLRRNATVVDNPGWNIITNYQARHESIDDEFGDRFCSGLGNSYSSAGFYLTGWMS